MAGETGEQMVGGITNTLGVEMQPSRNLGPQFGGIAKDLLHLGEGALAGGAESTVGGMVLRQGLKKVGIDTGGGGLGGTAIKAARSVLSKNKPATPSTGGLGSDLESIGGDIGNGLKTAGEDVGSGLAKFGAMTNPFRAGSPGGSGEGGVTGDAVRGGIGAGARGFLGDLVKGGAVGGFGSQPDTLLAPGQPPQQSLIGQLMNGKNPAPRYPTQFGPGQ